MPPRITTSGRRSTRKSKKPVTKGQNPQRANRQRSSNATVTQGDTGSRYRPMQGNAAAGVTQSGFTAGGTASNRVTNNTPPPIVKSPGGALQGPGGQIQPYGQITPPGVGATGPRGMRPRLPPAGPIPRLPIPSVMGAGQRLIGAAKAGPHPLAILGQLLLGAATGPLTDAAADAITNHVMYPALNAMKGEDKNFAEQKAKAIGGQSDTAAAQPSGSQQFNQVATPARGAGASALPSYTDTMGIDDDPTNPPKPATPPADKPAAPQPPQGDGNAGGGNGSQAAQQLQISPQQARRQEFNRRYDQMRAMVEAGTLDEETFALIGMQMHKLYFGKK